MSLESMDDLFGVTDLGEKVASAAQLAELNDMDYKGDTEMRGYKIKC
jgi:hypothetical protein